MSWMNGEPPEGELALVAGWIDNEPRLGYWMMVVRKREDEWYPDGEDAPVLLYPVRKWRSMEDITEQLGIPAPRALELWQNLQGQICPRHSTQEASSPNT